MRVLIGCERSGALRSRFRAAGHEAYSVDLEASEDGGEGHFKTDVFALLSAAAWDLFIVHPECTYLTSSGLHWNSRVEGRQDQTEEATEFAVRLWRAGKRHARRVALENPIGRLGPVFEAVFGIRPQIIQPNQFGDDASKATCWWLHNLPELRPTSLAPPRVVNQIGTDLLGEPIGTPRWSNQTDSGQNRLPPSDTRWMDRARTYPGVADAMVAQWGSLRPMEVAA